MSFKSGIYLQINSLDITETKRKIKHKKLFLSRNLAITQLGDVVWFSRLVSLQTWQLAWRLSRYDSSQGHWQTVPTWDCVSVASWGATSVRWLDPHQVLDCSHCCWSVCGECAAHQQLAGMVIGAASPGTSTETGEEMNLAITHKTTKESLAGSPLLCIKDRQLS